MKGVVTHLLVLMIVSGCRTWRAVPQPSALTRPLAAHSRVVRTNGERTEIIEGRVTRDSVIGLSRAGRVSVPRDSVEGVEERRLNWARSTGLFLAVYFGMMFMISDSKAPPSP